MGEKWARGKKSEGLYERLEQAKVDKIQAADLEIPCFAINRPVKKVSTLGLMCSSYK